MDGPSEFAILTLFDPRNGAPKAVIDATGMTKMRTGAMTAIGARYMAPPEPKVLGYVGARGTACWNVRLLAHFFDFEEIRVHSRHPESRESFADRLESDLGRKVIATDDWISCLEGANIMVEASRLRAPEPLFRTEWIKRGSLVIPYGTMSAVELSLTNIMDKVVMDDRGRPMASSGHLGIMSTRGC